MMLNFWIKNDEKKAHFINQNIYDIKKVGDELDFPKYLFQC